MVLLVLQLTVIVGAADWGDPAFQQVLIERLVNQSPMGLVGLLLMLKDIKIDHVQNIIRLSWIKKNNQNLELNKTL